MCEGALKTRTGEGGKKRKRRGPSKYAWGHSFSVREKVDWKGEQQKEVHGQWIQGKGSQVGK